MHGCSMYPKSLSEQTFVIQENRMTKEPCHCETYILYMYSVVQVIETQGVSFYHYTIEAC